MTCHMLFDARYYMNCQVGFASGLRVLQTQVRTYIDACRVHKHVIQLSVHIHVHILSILAATILTYKKLSQI